MKRPDDFDKRRAKVAALSDEELYRRFWDLTAQVVDPLVELGKNHTTPSIERSVLLRMGISSLDAKAIVEKCIDRGLLGKGAGHVVYKYAKARSIPVEEAGVLLAGDKGESGGNWDKAAALFGK
ncbi:MAG: ornithine aminomutase subunit alpha [Treponema sp.]|jgi:D-ornithine 4,5-aminomutase subunit alpha|nr:ornithine aminomutase subunit alpha [Treponema sp.]